MLDRRRFLAAAAGVTVGFCLLPAGGIAQNTQVPPPMLRRNPRADSWLHIGADGLVRVTTGRAELGQGIQTALAQIVAEELDLNLGSVRVETVDTGISPDEGYTFGSVSIQLGGSALRHAAAFLRRLLLERAAEILNRDVSALETRDGRVHARGADPLPYARIAAELRLDIDVGAATPKAVEQYSQVGRDSPRVDIPAKVFADSVFIQDFRPPDMVHARVVKPPAYRSRLADLDAEELDDDIELLRDGSFLAVLSQNEYRAVRAAAEVAQRARWSSSEEDDQSASANWLDAADVEPEIVHASGDRAGSTAARFAASYRRDFQAHAALSPSMALARFEKGELRVWSHAQGMFPLRGAIARVVGLDEARVRCIHMQSSGVYGHNGADDAACDAALIAVSRPGTTIRLQYSRADEFATEPLGSAMRIDLGAETGSDGRILRWDGEVRSGPHSARPNGRQGAGFLESSGLLAQPLPPSEHRPLALPRGGADRNAVPFYDFGSIRIGRRFIADTPVRVSALRSLGAYANTFAIESFVDEIATAHDADPFDYRLMHLNDDRARSVLERLRGLCRRERRADRNSFGIAFGRYKNSAVYCAVAARVRVDAEQRRLVTERVIAVVDAGLIINPDGVRNQIEGGIVQSTSWTLKERVPIAGRARSSVDWASYPILRFSEVPEVTVELMARPDEAPLGVGEASQGPTAAAIANGIAAATGVRLRELPLRFDDWRANSIRSAAQRR